MGKLISIEGSDGSGKQTQTEKLYYYFLNKNIETIKISFPNYESDSSALVKMYLNGDFGSKPNDVNAYTASLFYAVDRFASFHNSFKAPYDNGVVVISDRYTTSSMIHQASKIFDKKERDEYINWLEDLEYIKLGLPKPDIVIFLNVPISYTKKLMENRANKITGQSKKDIHEKDMQYLEDCYNNAIEIAKLKGWKIIECIENNQMKSIDEIHQLIVKEVELINND